MKEVLSCAEFKNARYFACEFYLGELKSSLYLTKRGRFVYEKDGKRFLIPIEEAKRYCEKNTALQFGYNFDKLLKYTLCDFFKHDYDEDTVAYLKKINE